MAGLRSVDRPGRPWRRVRRGSSAASPPPPLRSCSRALAFLLVCLALGSGVARAQTRDGDGFLPKKQVVRRALQSDPGQEYFVYVPSTGGRGAAMFVAVHGLSRNAEVQANWFASYCETYAVVLVAPLFDTEAYPDYQRLGRVGLGGRADVVLDSIVAEVAALTGAAAKKIYLFGFSGGAQFAHRYLMAHPQQVARAVVASAGWYTFPDARTGFPYGIGPSPDLPGVRFDAAEFLRVPITVVVGEQDTTGKSLRRNAHVDRQQGITRIERARNWVAAMRTAAAAQGLESRIAFEPVADMDHSFQRFMQEGKLGDRVFAALFGVQPDGASNAAAGAAPGRAPQPVGGAR